MTEDPPVEGTCRECARTVPAFRSKDGRRYAKRHGINLCQGSFVVVLEDDCDA